MEVDYERSNRIYTLNFISMAREEKKPEIFVPISSIMLINHFLLVLNTQRIFHGCRMKHTQKEKEKKNQR